MEIKAVIKRLELANDINELTLNELAEKYLSNKEDYSKFLKEYSEFFETHVLYQLRAFPQYKKILDLVNYGNLMYPSESNETYGKFLLTDINYNIDKYNLNGSLEDELQAKCLFDMDIGKYKSKGRESYEKIVKGMYKAAEKYDKKRGRTIENLDAYLSIICLSMNKVEFEKLFVKYCNDHPLAKECNDINFLYLTNYLLSYKPNMVDQEFIQDVKDVIKGSFAKDYYGIKYNFKDYSMEDYGRVAKFTLKKIKKFEKNKAKALKKK